MKSNCCESRHGRWRRRQFLWLSAGITLQGCTIAQSAARSGGQTALRPYISRSEHLEPLLPFQKQSFYKQPWRGYGETVPAKQMLSGVGVVYNLPAEADHLAAVQQLAGAGFRALRLEIPWASIPWSEDRVSDPRPLLGILRACREHQMVPLILLNAHHGVPGPHRIHRRTLMRTAQAGDRLLQLDRGDELIVGRSGLSLGAEPVMAEFLFTAIDPATDLVELSKPLPRTLDRGTALEVQTLKYAPLHPVGTAEFSRTAAGWVRYAGLVCDLVSAGGIEEFEVEIWNELTFGSSYLDIGNYYEPRPAAVTDTLKAKGSAWELAKMTVAALKPSYPKSKILWGFSNTTFYHTPIDQLPPGIDGQSYHPYGTDKRRTPRDFPPQDRRSWFIEDYVPQNLVKCMPEGWTHLGIQTEHLPRLLEPEARHVRPPGTQTFTHYMSEHGFKPLEAGITEPQQAQVYKAKCLIRSLLFWLNKGITKMHVYCAYEPEETGYGLLLVSGQRQSSALVALENALVQFQGARSLARTRSLEVEVNISGKQHPVFVGDKTHPPLYYQELFTFLPFQVNAHKFICGVYVMSYDITNPPPPMEFQLRLGPVLAKTVKVSYYDPILDQSVPVKLLQRTEQTVTVSLTALEYPRLLTVEET